MDCLTDRENKALVENMRKHRDRVFPGRGGLKRFARAIGVSSPSLSRWLNGRLTPPSARLHAIAKALGMDVGELCGRQKMETDAPGDLPEIMRGQIDAIDTQILLLRHNKRALLGETDAKRHHEGVRIIGELLKSELGDK